MKAETRGPEFERPTTEVRMETNWSCWPVGWMVTASSAARRLIIVANFLSFLVVQHVAFSETPESKATVILVVGAPGEPEYGSNFLHQATLWQNACKQAEAQVVTIGVEYPNGTNDFDLLKSTLTEMPRQSATPLWVVLIGHGSFDGKEAWFNLRGPDFSGSDLADWLRPFQRPIAIINTASCSGPFLNKLSGTNRVVITSTRSGNEQNFARFGQYLAEAITDPQADIDHDGQVSLLEAFLTASHEANEFYKSKGRLVTEHALIDDNGDGLGTPVEWFRGLRATKQAKDGASLDGPLAQQFCLVPGPADRALSPQQIAQRDALEKQVLALREQKAHLPEDDYYQQLETLLLQLARFYSANSETNSAR